MPFLSKLTPIRKCSFTNSPLACFKLPKIWCISPSARRLLRVVIQYSLLCFVLAILIIWLGAQFEDRQVHKVPDTLYFYSTPLVCGLRYPSSFSMAKTNISNTQSTRNSNGSGDAEKFVAITFPNETEALATPNTFIAHCGDCGQCSTPRDIKIYDDTKNELFVTTVDCAKKAIFGGRRAADRCMQERVGFTSGCNNCWVKNIMCDVRLCIFTCIWHGLWGEVDKGGANKTLNRCTLCDERRCGPAFITCAGANRRRAGILSDIERNTAKEVCRADQPHWWDNESLQEAWEEDYAASSQYKQVLGVPPSRLLRVQR